MEKLKREELKKIAMENGIENGFNGRRISKMRKSDFLEFISQIRTPVQTPHSQTHRQVIQFVISPGSHSTPVARRSMVRRRLFAEGEEEDLLSSPLALLSFLFPGPQDYADSEEVEPQRAPFVGKINEEDKDDEQEASDEVRCKVCLHNKISILFKNCKHLVTCERCSAKVDKCPVCKDQIKKEDREKIFF
ncbi:Apoptosis inhibitor IAP [Armadillidium vulgare iridescent virus]|uniref:Apoptosis inhibitor IAP n=1 Tax=Armadillidium vulgare iridescent virus TaxID=72201 RepID=A0A068QKY3_9VIRU|nr:Apoptosis inhibitor IAP [Armadillidium vulgare iridescent virus]CCV02523.1 Apoptosis inhibitor IAP [Armadillidium vulgare iridescent virus]